jgi:hypothetical protein
MNDFIRQLGAILPLVLAIAFSAMTFAAGKLMGTKAAEIQESWSEMRNPERWFNTAVVAFTFVAILALLALLGLVREWAASVVQTTDGSPALAIPSVVTAGFMAIACLGLLMATVTSFWLTQKRGEKERAYRALKTANARLQKSLAKRWTPYAQKRDALISAYEAKMQVVRTTAFSDINAFNYGVVDTNRSGKKLATGLLSAPDERLLPMLRVPEKSGSLLNDLQRWLQISLPKLPFIKSVKTTKDPE